MNGSEDDIRWVSAQRPTVAAPDAVATSQARAELMRHAARTARRAHVVAAPAAARPRRRRIAILARPRRGLAIAATLAVVAAAAITATLALAPRLGHSGIDAAISPGVANAQTLVLLANHIADSPRHGDATLVFHSNTAQGERPFTGADLYLDNGRYYFAETPAGLPAAVKAGPQHLSLKRILGAMAAVSGADPQDARAAFLKAADPLYGGDVQRESAARQDNIIWVASIDVLGAAYGRPTVLAGTLRALSTVRGVTVTHGTSHGMPTLQIAMWVPKQTANIAPARRKLDPKSSPVHKTTTPAHFMRATVNARTGALMRYTDIGLIVTYRVSRVNVARYGGR